MNATAGAGPRLTPPTPVPRCLAILGPGLIGGSLIRALRSLPSPPALRVWGRSERSLESVRQFLATDAVLTTSAREVVAEADGVILCTPVEAMPELTAQFVGVLGPETWVTDAGSVKGSVVQSLTPLLEGRFLGAHPMAGSEKTGFVHSSANLFEDAVCILTPTAATSVVTQMAVTAFWQSVGCRLLVSTPEAHDRAIAAISHVPHVVAAALVLSANDEAQTMTGPGFRDCTRIAMGDAGLWTGILTENRPALIEALTAFRHQLDTFIQVITDSSDSSDSSEVAGVLGPTVSGQPAALFALLQQAASRRQKLRLQSADRPSVQTAESL